MKKKSVIFIGGGGLYSGNSKFFRKSFLNVSGSAKIALKSWEKISRFFAVFGENFGFCSQRIYCRFNKMMKKIIFLWKELSKSEKNYM